jgi:hypothetical protein
MRSSCPQSAGPRPVPRSQRSALAEVLRAGTSRGPVRNAGQSTMPDAGTTVRRIFVRLWTWSANDTEPHPPADQLMYDAGVGWASLWADGNLLALDAAGTSIPVTSLEWGGGQHPPGSAYANRNEVSLWAIPEPSSVALLGVGSLLFAARLRRGRAAVFFGCTRGQSLRGFLAEDAVATTNEHQ